MIDINVLFAIESSNDPSAHDEADDSRGLGQITPGVRRDFNKATGKNITPKDLFDSDINAEVTDWYANTEIPRLLGAFGIQDTEQNRIVAYNAGIGNLKKILEGKMELPEVTSDYLIKYQWGGDVTAGQQKLKDMGFDPGPIDGLFGPKTRSAFQKFQESDLQATPVKKFYGLQTLKR